MNLEPNYYASISPIICSLESTVRRLTKREKIPTRARNVHGKAILQFTDELYLLQLEDFGESSSEFESRLNGEHKFEFSLSKSACVVVDGAVFGVTFVLKKQFEDISFIYYSIVRKDVRRTWVTPFLRYKTLVNLKQHGVNKIAFQILDDKLDTVRFASKFNAQQGADVFDWS